ncbi:MAG: transcriptional regulator with XRE-family HTH domain [Halocynthiibacter sp.]|jgi:transcriptional regulator with XRE-family HTH domain
MSENETKMSDPDAQTSNDWYGEGNATFGDRLVAAREAAAMSPRELARRLGIKDKTLRNWEEDAAEPRANKLQMLAGVLNVSMRWLLSGEGDGIDGPDQPEQISPELEGLLLELRALRVQMMQGSEKLARLEKALRRVMKEG